MLILLFSACPSKTTPSDSSPVPTGDTADVCVGDVVEGQYIQGWESCYQDTPLEAYCQEFDWWNAPGCPSFQEFVLYILAIPWYHDGVLILQRCEGEDGNEYDFAYFDPWTIDGVTTSEGAIFNTSGNLVRFFITTSSIQDPPVCCDGHEIPSPTLAYGEFVGLDCDPPLATYTPSDFLPEETADTGTDTADTSDTGS